MGAEEVLTLDFAAGTRPAARVTTAVANLEDTDPQELPRLDETIDPDALNRLFRTETPTSSVTFMYHGYEILVHGDRRITILKPGEQGTSGV